MTPREIMTKEFLEEHFVRLGKTCKEISIELNCAQSSVVYNLNKHRIIHRNRREPTRQCREAQRKRLFKGCGDLGKFYYHIIKVRAKRLNRDFDLTVEYMWSLYEAQKRKCSLSGLDIYISPKYRGKNRLEQTASLDRIDSLKGYVVGNVQWVHKDINKMKQDLPEERFIELCKHIARFRQ